ncbi:MAG: hypothetical protein GF383_14380 [Candidatus Lokiarchaeota archaeon]|nr:hypothetical protein [Candidatus Lokiarchaeota archaeon]MBD3342574.1 hypothetical protein [Candidatus Lokiarchaeota archaeon]
MAKKKKEQCPYCGKWYVYLSRHKCKVKERLEAEEDEKTEAERRAERIEEKKKKLQRGLKKEEKKVLNLINQEKTIYFNELVELADIERTKLEQILDVLALQSRIKVRRELYNSSWTKHISSIEDYSDDIETEEVKVSKKKKDFIWDMFGRQPCFICPFVSRCNETNMDLFNPHHCPWLTDWIELSLTGGTYDANFEEIQAQLESEQE